MNSYTRREIQEAWQYIFDAAESILEDDINEDDEMSDEDFDRRMDLAFEILRNPQDWTGAL